jgi:CRP/FNR family transcriptional regulator, transcriptional activator FtrB
MDRVRSTAVDTLDGGFGTAPAATAREALGEVPWLDAVSSGTLDQLAEQSVLHRMPSGSMLFEQSETPAFLQVLVGGSVELLAVRGTDEMLVEFVRAIDLLLPAAVLNRQPYLLRARVLDEAHLVLVHAETFRQAVTADHALCLAVLACQAGQFRCQIKHAKNLTLRSAEQRAGCYLLRLADEAPPGAPIRLPLEKRLIASQLGMTRETFSRTLAAVARHGLRVEGDVVIVENATAARTRFRLDPLIDGPETVQPLPLKKV